MLKYSDDSIMSCHGHFGHAAGEHQLVSIDPHLVAMHPMHSLVRALRGAFHATSCHNLQYGRVRNMVCPPGGRVANHQKWRSPDCTRMGIVANQLWLLHPHWCAAALQRHSERERDVPPELKDRLRRIGFDQVKEFWFAIPKKNLAKEFFSVEKTHDYPWRMKNFEPSQHFPQNPFRYRRNSKRMRQIL